MSIPMRFKGLGELKPNIPMGLRKFKPDIPVSLKPNIPNSVYEQARKCLGLGFSNIRLVPNGSSSQQCLNIICDKALMSGFEVLAKNLPLGQKNILACMKCGEVCKK